MRNRRKRRKPAPALNLGYLHAATVLVRQPERDPITIILVGCGGTGSYMAQHIGQLLRCLTLKGVQARALFVDHDHVEQANIDRQLFADAELGLNKAQALAMRYTGAWGADITAITSPFTASIARPPKSDGITILVGCVDNPAARQEMANVLKRNKPGSAPDFWWLDCGNHAEAGQVLLGSAISRNQIKNAFPTTKICQALPAPSVQHPELLTIKPQPTSSKRMSCAELVEANMQSRDINKRIAAEASTMLTQLLLTRDLKRFASELNLAAGVMTSSYPTPETISRFKFPNNP